MVRFVFHLRFVVNVLCVMGAVVGAAMLVPATYSILANDGMVLFFAAPAVAAIIAGSGLFLLTKQREPYVFMRDIFLIVVLGWVVVSIVGAVPFVFSGTVGYVDAFFNSMAGFTTTGAHTLSPEEFAPSLLLWRSLNQWIGGIGIVLLFVSVAPLVSGGGATNLFSAEMANPIPERMTPRIRDSAVVLVNIYVGLTVLVVVMLLASGLGLFDAVNHAFTTVATGGYSTSSDSIATFDSWAVELSVIVGMILAGTNFTLYFYASQGWWYRVARDRELRTYLGIIIAATILLTASLYALDYQQSLALSFREALFQSVSLTTGTAFTTAEWGSWDPFSQTILLLLMALGSCAGSTSGGLKMVRVYLLTRQALQELVRMVHPAAMLPLTAGERLLSERVRISVLAFFLVYVAGMMVGTLLITLHQVPMGEAFGSVFACMTITGSALPPVGDPEFYASLPASAKLILTVFMLLGRLEIFTVLVLISPAFWRG